MDANHIWEALDVANHTPVRVRVCVYECGRLCVLVCVSKPISV